MFCLSKPIAFLPFSLPSPSSLFKLPNLSWQRRQMLEEKYGLPFCSRVQPCTGKSCMHFFLPYLQDRGLLRSRNIATMATWRSVLSPLGRSRREVSAEVDDTLREAVLFMPIKRLILGKGDFFHLGLSEFDNHPIISQMLNFCDVTPLFSVVLKKVSGETSDIHFEWRVKRLNKYWIELFLRCEELSFFFLENKYLHAVFYTYRK